LRRHNGKKIKNKKLRNDADEGIIYRWCLLFNPFNPNLFINFYLPSFLPRKDSFPFSVCACENIQMLTFFNMFYFMGVSEESNESNCITESYAPLLNQYPYIVGCCFLKHLADMLFSSSRCNITIE
jgi:hypothetical protein